jgi:hypothetical protein
MIPLDGEAFLNSAMTAQGLPVRGRPEIPGRGQIPQFCLQLTQRLYTLCLSDFPTFDLHNSV